MKTLALASVLLASSCIQVEPVDPSVDQSAMATKEAIDLVANADKPVVCEDLAVQVGLAAMRYDPQQTEDWKAVLSDTHTQVAVTFNLGNMAQENQIRVIATITSDKEDKRGVFEGTVSIVCESEDPWWHEDK